jgi:putative endonuclease
MNRQSLGYAGEDAAAALLSSKGLRIISRNWRRHRLEIDIVAEEGDTLVFVEVKARSSTERGEPLQAVNAAKRSALGRAATAYLAEHNLWHRPCRFDLVSIVMQDDKPVAEHISHAFDLSQFMGRRNAPWQPW